MAAPAPEARAALTPIAALGAFAAPVPVASPTGGNPEDSAVPAPEARPARTATAAAAFCAAPVPDAGRSTGKRWRRCTCSGGKHGVNGDGSGRALGAAGPGGQTSAGTR